MNLTYTEVKGKVSRSRDKNEGALVCGNTRLRVSHISPVSSWDREGAVFALVLHYTEIVRWFPSGLIGSSLNGWNTVTTKRRLRTYGPMMGIGNYKGNFHAWYDGKVWPGTEYTWFYMKHGRICFEDGEPVPETYPARQPRPIPKSRDILACPLPGDAFRDPSGKAWVCVKFETQNVLLSYLGDHPDDSRYIIRRDEAVLGLSTLELLVLAAPGWEAIPRFTWSRTLRGTPARVICASFNAG